MTPSVPKDFEIKDMTVNTKSHKRLTCSVCCLLAATERESITIHFGINLKQLHILKLIIVGFRDALFGRQYYWEQHIGPILPKIPIVLLLLLLGLISILLLVLYCYCCFKISRLLGCIQFIIGIVLLLYITKPSLQMNQIRRWYQEILIFST